MYESRKSRKCELLETVDRMVELIGDESEGHKEILESLCLWLDDDKLSEFIIQEQRKQALELGLERLYHGEGE